MRWNAGWRGWPPRPPGTFVLKGGMLLAALDARRPTADADLLAVRAPPAVAEQRRRRLHREARDHGKTPRAEILARADWTLLVADARTSPLSLQEAPVLLRARWQIELLFTVWKQYGQIDAPRSAKPWRVLREVWARLLAVLVPHWLALTGCWQYPHRSLVKTAQVVRAQATQLLASFATCLVQAISASTAPSPPPAASTGARNTPLPANSC